MNSAGSCLRVLTNVTLREQASPLPPQMRRSFYTEKLSSCESEFQAQLILLVLINAR